MRSAIDGVLPDPFEQQHVSDGQQHRPDEQAEKTVDNHAAHTVTC